jgi:uncharacterized membrane protein YhaH (DUF805 family)
MQEQKAPSAHRESELAHIAREFSRGNFWKLRINRPSYWAFMGILLGTPYALSRLELTPPTVVLLLIFAICAMRLHDLGLSGWWALPVGSIPALHGMLGQTHLMAAILMAAGIAIMALGLFPGQREQNKYGPLPQPGLFGWSPFRSNPPTPGQPTNHLGITSVIAAIAGLTLYTISAASIGQHLITGGDLSTVGNAAWAGYIACTLLLVVAFALGVIALIKKERQKAYAITGMVISCVPALWFLHAALD